MSQHLESAIAPDQVRWGPDGLVPAVVSDPRDGRVLMLAWMDAQALAATQASGEVHFHSRSRGRLWRKGEESGNVLRLRGLALDCDADAILVTAEPAGPTCHTGARSCFDVGPTAGAPFGRHAGTIADTRAGTGSASQERRGFAWLDVLATTIAGRAAERPEGSYTVRLLERGVDGPARKVAEEAVEVLMAAKDDAAAQLAGASRDASRPALAGEAADLLYHLLVLLQERGLTPDEVIAVLRARHGG